MEFTLASMVPLGILLFISFSITNGHVDSYATSFCSENEKICIDVESGKISSKWNYDFDEVTSITLEQKGERINCDVQSGRLLFEGACSKASLLNLIRSGSLKNTKLLVPELGIASVNIEPAISIFLRILILNAEASWILALDILNILVTTILAILNI
jgi:hypothetical protein